MLPAYLNRVDNSPQNVMDDMKRFVKAGATN